MCVLRIYRLKAISSEITDRIRVVVALAALPVLLLVASTPLFWGMFRHSISQAIIHTTFLSIFLYGLIAVFGRFRLIRALIGLVIATEIFVRYSYGTKMSLVVVMSILNSSPGEACYS